MDSPGGQRRPSKAGSSTVSESSTFVERRKIQEYQTQDESEEGGEQGYKIQLSWIVLTEMLVFLPFSVKWCFILSLLCGLSYIFSLYRMCYDREMDTFQEAINYATFLVIFLDIIFSMMHINFTSLREKRSEKAKKVWTLLLDLLSIIPEFIWVFIRNTTLNENLKFYLFLDPMRLLRIIRVGLFFSKLDNDVGTQSLTFISLHYGTWAFFVIHTLGCIWYVLAQAPHTTWISDFQFSSSFSSDSDWYLLCSYFITTTIFSTGFGDITATNEVERLVATIAMMAGFALLYGAFIGAVSSQQVALNRRHEEFLHRVKLIQRYLAETAIPRAIREKTIEFYNLFWQRNEGVMTSDLFDSLPLPVKQEAAYDYCYDMFQHSHILNLLNKSFLRTLSLYTKTEVFMPGELVYVQSKLKEKCIYVMQGVVQILSVENDKSPMLSLTVGTLLGEISLVLSCPGKASVRAATYCIVRTLHKSDLCKAASNFPDQHATMRNLVDMRLGQARFYVSSVGHAGGRRKRNEPMKAVKRNLRAKEVFSLDDEFMLWLPHETTQVIYKSSTLRESVVDVEPIVATGSTDLYVLSKPVALKTDDVCVEINWPWIFNPNSEFIVVWETFVFFVVLFVCFVYPYYIAFIRNLPESMLFPHMLISLIYILDFSISIQTAIETKTDFLSTVKEIALLKIGHVGFWLDIMAMIPLEYLFLNLILENRERWISFLTFNKLFKAWKVPVYFKNLEYRTTINILIVRGIKYVVYLLIIEYIAGATFYAQACFYDQCLYDSWYTVLVNKEVDADEITPCYEIVFELALYFGAIVLSATGYGDITPNNMRDLITVLFLIIIGMLLFTFCVAELSATLGLKISSRTDYDGIISGIHQYMNENNIPETVKKRVYSYLSIEWDTWEGYHAMNFQPLMWDATSKIQGAILAFGLGDILYQSIPLFQMTDSDFVKEVADTAEQFTLSPNEIITRVGERSVEFYIVQKGFCELESGVIGEDVKIVGPGSHFSAVEMLLNIPCMNTVRAITHCKIISIKQDSLLHIISRYPKIAKEMYRVIEAERSELDLSKIMNATLARTHVDVEEQKVLSWFVYETTAGSPQLPDYLRPFEALGTLKFLKYLLMQRTILPNGPFIHYWEVIMTISSVCSAFLYPTLYSFAVPYPFLDYICMFFDLMACVNLYLQLHVGYFNFHGILVRHPLKTAIHYLKSGFIIDVLGCFPMGRILYFKKYIKKRYILHMSFLQNIFRMPRQLQLRRLISGISYLEQDILQQSDILKFLKWVPLSICYINALASFIVSFTCEFYVDHSSHNVSMQCTEGSWIGQLAYAEKSSPSEIYITAVYWVAVTTFTVGFGDISATNAGEMYFCVFCVTSGALLIGAILVVVSTGASPDATLITYQSQMKELDNFVKVMNVRKDIHRSIIEHFEHVWQKTRGIKAYHVYQRLHSLLKEDFCLSIYRNSLVASPVFKDSHESLLRMLSTNFEEQYFTKGSTILSCNQIVNDIWFVHKGEVTVYASDETKLCILTTGSCVGNLDFTECCRSSVTIKASAHTDALVINTMTFYSIMKLYPRTFERYSKAMTQNSDFLASTADEYEMEKDKDEDKLSEGFTDFGIKKQPRYILLPGTLGYKFSTVFVGILAYVSCILTPYHLAFQDHRLTFLAIICAVEVLFILKIILGFRTAYEDERGEIITDLKKIRHMYIKDYSKFYLDAISTFPLDLLALLAPEGKRLQMLSYYRLIHLLRLFILINSYKVSYDKLTLNMVLMVLSGVFVLCTLVYHFFTCMWYMLGCHGGYCYPEGWAVHAGIDPNQYLQSYFMSLYFVLAVLTTTGFGDIYAHTKSEKIFCTVMVISTSYLLAVVTGRVSSIVENSNLVEYENSISIMTDYLKNNNISGGLLNKLLDYVKQLWMTSNGVQWPVMCNELHIDLIISLKYDMYGKYLLQNPVLNIGHNSLLRQIAAKFEHSCFFEGNNIVQEGDVNNTMYFIEKGEVMMFSTDSQGNEVVERMLYAKGYFGMAQGLCEGMPHEYSYKAKTVTVIISLDFANWGYLLTYYPSIKEEIYRRAVSVGLNIKK